MPRKHVRERGGVGPHHVYNRARTGRAAFRDDEDRETFLELIAIRLRRNHHSRRFRKTMPVFGAAVSSYCLMNSHFHLIIWQAAEGAVSSLMRGVIVSYTALYNRKYHQSGPLFDGPFRSRPLIGAKDLRWTTAYVHANHPSGLDFRYSSHRAFVEEAQRPAWLSTATTLDIFGGLADYERFMCDHAERARLNRQFFANARGPAWIN